MYTLDHIDDSLLWKAFIKGDDHAFTQLYDRYVRILYSYGLKMQPKPAIVEDAVQDLFVDLWRLRSGLSETDSVKFYLFRALRRRLHKSLRPEELPMHDSPDDFSAYMGVEPSFEDVLVTSELAEQKLEKLQHWLDKLPIRQQEALLLRYYQDFSYIEIAALFSITEQSARNLVQKALHKLRQLAFLMILPPFYYIINFFSGLGG